MTYTLKYIYRSTAVLHLLIFCANTGLKAQGTSHTDLLIVPQPKQIVEQKETFGLNTKTQLILPGENEAAIAIPLLFNQHIQYSTGKALKVANKVPKKNYIRFSLDDACGQGAEGYCLSVTPKRIEVNAATPHGLFYGMQTLLQLLPAEVENRTQTASLDWAVPAVEITDAPRFPWRGMHLDVCRHFLPVEFIKKQLDVMAMYKLNTLHWHLTEDQGWRIEIKKYPKLTEIGSVRMENGKPYGGYYTQAQIKDVVAYAAKRFINVVPEIELPGHALAAIAAYPKLACNEGPFKVRNKWGVEPEIYCAGKEETFEFLEGVIDEVTQLFPYEYFHIGGDEAPKGRWKKSPLCQKRIKEEGLKDEHELQSYFVKRVEKMLLARNKKMIGWDEILEGGLAPSATVMSWRGEKGGVEAANEGHDVIMTPNNFVYLDHYQGSRQVEPVAIGGYTTLKEAYQYEPVPPQLDAAKAKHVLGTQGNVWTEYMYTPEVTEYRIYPRIIALAEVGWSAKGRKDYQDFLQRLNNQWTRLDLHDINYHIPLPEGPIDHIAFTDQSVLKFTTTRPIKMVYTLDGSEPNAQSTVYTAPLTLDQNTTVKIRSILPTDRMSKVRTIQVVKEPLAAPAVVADVQPGLLMKQTEGEYYIVDDLNKVKMWKEQVVTNLKQVYPRATEDHGGAAILTGYLQLDQDGVYEFSTDVDQWYIDGKLLINNDGEVKRFSRNNASVALAQGLHPIKIVYLNNIFGGWPQARNGVKVKYKAPGKHKWKEFAPNQLFYKP